MKRCILLIMGFSIIFISCYGQIDQETKEWLNKTIYQKNVENFNHPSVKGSPFYLDKFVQGSIYFKNNKKEKGAKLNYNMKEDIFCFQQANQIYTIKNIKDIQRIDIEGETFINTQFINSNEETQSGFLMVLAKGDCELYKRIRKEFKEAKEAGAYSSSQDAHFVKQEPKYYIKTPSMEAIESINKLWNKTFLKTLFPGVWRKKFIDSLFPDEKEKLLKLIEENNIQLKNEKGLIKFVNLYNNLD